MRIKSLNQRRFNCQRESFDAPTNRGLVVLMMVWLLALFFTGPTYGSQVFAWGRNTYNQLNIPASLTNPVDISAGYQHCLGLKGDGSVVAWGSGTNGQNTVPAWLSNNVVSVRSGYYHNLVQLNDGSLAAWGAGLTNAGAGFDYGQSIIPPNLTNVIAFAAGGYFNLALLSDHSVVAWGRNVYGETNLPAGMTNIAAISAAGMHSVALKGDGTVVAWGGNGSGESSVPAGLSNIVAVVAGDYNSYAIRSDGTIAVWGDNTSGQDTVPAGVSNAVAAAGAAYHSVVIEDNGNPVAWGQYDSTLPVGVTNAFELRTGFYMGLGLTNDGSPVITFQPPCRWIFSGNDTALRALVAGSPPMSYQWLSNGVPILDATNALLSLPAVQTNQAGNYSFIASNSLGAVTSSNAVLTVIQQPPILTTQPASQTTYRFNVAGFTAVAVGSPPLTYQWQLNGTNLPDATNVSLSYTAVSPGQTGNYSIVVSNQFGMVTSTNAYLTILAVKDFGGSSAVPTSLTNAIAVAAGSYHAMALKPDNTLVVWGNNLYHQTNIPAAATNIMAIAAAGGTCAVIRSNGTLVMWGDSYFPGIASSKTNPHSGATNVAAISIGDNHCLVLRKNGTVVAWGNNYYGQTNIPASATNIMAVAAGSQHSLLLRSNGTLIVWGYNYYGQTNLPPALGLTNVVAIAAANNNNFALKADGSAYAWGQAAISYPAYPNVGVVRIGAGFYSGSYYTVLRSDGSVTAYNVTGVSNAIAISTYGQHNLVLLGDGSPDLYWPPNSLPAAHPGDNVSTRVFVSGNGPIYYQWQLNGTNLLGETNAALTLTNIPITSAGSYQCIISNALGVVTSPATTLNMTRWPLAFSSTNAFTQMTTNGFNLRLTGLAGQGPLVVYASTNLLDWVPVFTNSPVVGSFDFIDSNATNQPALYYRATEGP